MTAATKATETFSIDSIGVIQNVKIDLSSILPPDGSSDTELIVINELQDDSKNIDFRFDILPTDIPLGSEPIQTLTLDVKPASILDGINLSDASDTGVKGDLVTSEQRPEITFITDEEIRIDTSLELGDGLSNPRLVHLSTLSSDAPTLKYNLIVTASEELALEGGGTNYKYTAVLQDDATLVHGLWGVEVTDLAGNVTVSDATEVLKESDPYFANSDLNSDVNGIILIDQLGPPEPLVSIVGVEAEGGFLNSTEATSSVAVSIARAIDTSSADPVAENRVANIELVEFDGTAINLASGQTEFTFDAATSDLSEGLHTLTVTTSDVAGNVTVTDYTFVKDTVAADPTSISIIGIGDDKVINKYEYLNNLRIDLDTVVSEDFVTSVTLNGLADLSDVSFNLELLSDGPILNADTLGLADGSYQLEVVTSDPAGNLRTDLYDFAIDTVVAEKPTITIESINGGLNYWETLEGLRVSFDVVSSTDRIFEDQVVVSTTQVSPNNLVVEGARVNDTTKFYISRDLLTDGENKISLRLEDEYFNDETYEYTFETALAPAPGVSFAVVNNLITTADGYELEYDIYITDEVIAEYIEDPTGGLNIDMMIKMPSGMGEVNETSVSFSDEFGPENTAFNLEVREDGIFVGAFSTDSIPATERPLVSFTVDLPDGWTEFDGTAIDENLVELSLIMLNGISVPDVTLYLDSTDLISQDLI